MGKSGRGKAVYAPKPNAIWSSTPIFRATESCPSCVL